MLYNKGKRIQFRVSELTPNEQFCRYIVARTSYILHANHYITDAVSTQTTISRYLIHV